MGVKRHLQPREGVCEQFLMCFSVPPRASFAPQAEIATISSRDAAATTEVERIRNMRQPFQRAGTWRLNLSLMEI